MVQFGTLSLTEILKCDNKIFSEEQMKLIATFILIILLSLCTTEWESEANRTPLNPPNKWGEEAKVRKANRKTKSSVNEVNTFSHKYYPNFVGNRWVLRSLVEPVEEHVVEITGKEFIAGQEVNVLTRHTHTGTDKFYIATFEDGVKVYRSEGNIGFWGNIIFDYVPPETLIPYPLEVGTTWEVVGETTVHQVELQANTVSTVVTMEDVTVPAGTFRNCLFIQQQHIIKSLLKISVTGGIWLAPNVGLVKEMNTSGVIFELVEYELFYPWDVNGDMKVDILDLLIVSNHFGEHITNTSKNNPDVNGDGSIDISDLVLIGRHFGEKY